MPKVARPLFLGLVSMLLSACSPPRVDDALTGRVAIDGSSSAYPIMEAFAEEFQIRHRDTKVTVGISGTGGGFQRFCSGEIDIAGASRPIRGSEIEACAEARVRFGGVPIAKDGVTIVTHPSNTFLECLTTEELRSIWQPGSSVRTWRDVRSVWPDREIRFYAPGTDSGTFQFFTEVINGRPGASRTDVQASENDNVLVRGVAGDPDGLGYFGYAYYTRNRADLRLVAVDDGAGCVTPTVGSVEDGSYMPLSRSLHVYLSYTALQRAAVLRFVEEMLEAGPTTAADAGYVPLSPSEYVNAMSVVRTAANGG